MRRGASPADGNGGVTGRVSQARQAASQPRPSVAARGGKTSDEDEDEGVFERYGVVIILGVIASIIGAVIFFHTPAEKSAPVRKAPEPQIVRIVPPPPPPPVPKVQPPPPKDEKKTEEAPTEKPAEKPAEKPKPIEKPPEGLGTNIKGPGTGVAGLGSSGNGMLGGTGKGAGGGGGSVAAWYAGKVQAKVSEAMRNHRKTRSATINGVKVSVWADASGRIARAQLEGSTGDAAVDAALRNEILTGLQLQEPPPAGMRMPIVLRLSARRPN